MIYDVNVTRIAAQLHKLRQCAQVLESVGGEFSGPVEQFALERALHLAVESMIDVGTVMIDGFIMRDPGGYLDIVDILEDERVIDADTSERLRSLVRFRDRLVRSYHELDGEELRPWVGETGLFHSFIDQVSEYLRKELGEELSL
ncbi:DUF86 domain-containing protein [Staphylospora marina]|uniref:DUF86 domain-containing protein n=1 Tax=Staphylospora marina TaxID=2490858 RepID=UPI001F153A0D|nr:DUF86 domain-containing protein [Staphylospora marina]